MALCQDYRGVITAWYEEHGMSPVQYCIKNRHGPTRLNMRATAVFSWQSCACRYVRESKVLFKVSGYADKALAGGEGAVSPHTPDGPHSAHGAPIPPCPVQMLITTALARTHAGHLEAAPLSTLLAHAISEPDSAWHAACQAAACPHCMRWWAWRQR